MQFQRGTYGEILLAPLVTDLLTEEVLQETVGEEVYRKMTPAERAALYDEVIYSIHWQNLQRALSGEETDDPKVMALYRAVMRGEPLNLYPMGLKKQRFMSFLPVLRRVGDELWQLGLPTEGHYALLMGAAGPILRQVWQLYRGWMEVKVAGDEV